MGRGHQLRDVDDVDVVPSRPVVVVMADQHEGDCCADCLAEFEISRADLEEAGACCCLSPLMEGRMNQ